MLKPLISHWARFVGLEAAPLACVNETV
jgi:hypothetical protein